MFYNFFHFRIFKELLVRRVPLRGCVSYTQIQMSQAVFKRNITLLFDDGFVLN